MMKKLCLLLLWIALNGHADDPLPWRDLKQLYRKQIEEEMKTSVKKSKMTLKSAAYTLHLGPKSVTGKVLIDGQWLAGDPRPIELFDRLTVTGHLVENGGDLLINDNALCFLPKGREAFQLGFSFALPIREDDGILSVQLDLPKAVQSSLAVKAGDDIVLLGNLNGEQISNTVFLAPGAPLRVSFRRKRRPAAGEPEMELDAIHQLVANGNQVALTSAFHIRRGPDGDLIVPVPKGAQFLSSDLKSSQIQQKDGKLHISLPPKTEGFGIVFELQATTKGDYQAQLPSIAGNQGNVNNVLVTHPENGEIVFESKMQELAKTQLPPELRHLDSPTFFRSETGIISFKLKRFAAVKAPDVVLPQLKVFSSFEDNGGTMTTLQMTVPRLKGSRLKIKAIEGAEVWSLRINGKKKSIFSDGNGGWIIPLQGNRSQVELAFLQKSPKLGLRGKVVAQIPAMGIPVQALLIHIGLPQRVQVLSFEGPVSTQREGSTSYPETFVGRPYRYERSFYNGNGMQVALYYEEPADAQPVAE